MHSSDRQFLCHRYAPTSRQAVLAMPLCSASSNSMQRSFVFICVELKKLNWSSDRIILRYQSCLNSSRPRESQQSRSWIWLGHIRAYRCFFGGSVPKFLLGCDFSYIFNEPDLSLNPLLVPGEDRRRSWPAKRRPRKANSGYGYAQDLTKLQE